MKSALIAFLLCTPVFAQVDDNANAWFMYFGDHPINGSKWGAHLEGQWRRTDLGLKWQQLLLRPGVNYQLTKNIGLTGGYGFVRSYPYGDFPSVAAAPEHRFFEQALIKKKLWKQEFQNRLRLEQRNLGVMTKQADGSYAPTAWRYENRFRYMLRTDIPLTKDKKNYIGLYNEIMFNFGKNVEKNVFDQNRAYIAYGRDLGRQTKLELGYLEQTIQRRGGLVFEHNHTLQIAIYSKLPFGGSK
jgi:hypothetical protein